MKQVDAILTADIHLTETTPISRTDNYVEAQDRKLAFLKQLETQYDCPVIDAGDIFDYWKASPWLIARAYKNLPSEIYTIPGNHDLPEHSMQQYEKSALHVLEVALAIRRLSKTPYDRRDFTIAGFAYGEKLEDVNADIVVIHDLVYEGNPPWPNAVGYQPKDLFKIFTKPRLILTGHYHMALVAKSKDGRLVVNPGSMMRMTIVQKDYKPRCYLYNFDDNEVEPVYFPIEEDVFDDRHIVEPKEKEERLSAFIEKLNMEWDLRLSFKANLEAFFKENKINKKVEELIWQSLE
mgnify:FL=1